MASRQQYELEVLLGAKQTAGFKSSITGARSSMNTLSSTATKVAGLITAAFAAVNITGFVTDAVEEFEDFETALTNTAAVAGASSTELEQLEDAAREAGRTTTKTAEDSAEALGYMALAGWDVEESTAALEEVLKLSTATGAELSTTSDLVTDSMSALGLEVDDLSEYLDVVIAANNNANTTAEQLMNGLIKAGGAARSLGIDVQDASTALGILADNGTKSVEGGRTLNAILTRISSNSTALKRLEELDIDLFDDAGDFVGLEEALKRINKGVESLSVEETAQALKDIAGTNYYSKMQYILDGVKESADGSVSAWDSLEASISNSEGSLSTMYDTMTDTLSAAETMRDSAWSDVQIGFADLFDDELKDINLEAADFLNDMSEKLDEFGEENEVEIHQFFEDVKDGAYALADGIGNAASFIVNHAAEIEGALAGIAAALVTSKVVGSVGKIATAVGSIATLSNPVGLTVGALALFSGAMVGIGTYATQTKKKMINAGLDEHFGDISLSLEELDDVAQQIVGREDLTQIADMLESIGETEDAVSDMSDALKSINGVSWKINAGLEIDTDDSDSYISSVQSYVDSAQDVIDSMGYSVSVATTLLFGEDSEEGAENDAFYASLDAELSALETKLNKKINKAVKNGVNIDTDEAIQELLGEIQEITDAVTNAETDASWNTLQLKYSASDLTADNFEQLSEDIVDYVSEADEGALEAYETLYTNYAAQLNTGAITQEQFDEKIAQAQAEYYDKKANTLLTSSDYLFDAIKEAYGISDAQIETYKETLEAELNNALNDENGVLTYDLGDVAMDALEAAADSMGLSSEEWSEVSAAFSSGLSDIFDEMSGLLDEQAASGDVSSETSQAIQDALSDMGIFADDSYTLEDVINSDENLAIVYGAAEEIGEYVTDGIGVSIRNTSDTVTEAVDYLANLLQDQIDSQLNFRITADLTTEATGSTKKEQDVAAAKKINEEVNNSRIYSNAAGGIYTSPILTTFAEDGAEAAIPLDGSARAKTLWTEAGKILGMDTAQGSALYNSLNVSAGQSGSSTTVTFAPNVTIQGNADEQAVTNALKLSMDDFAAMMDKYMAQKKRTAFA